MKYNGELSDDGSHQIRMIKTNSAQKGN